VSPLFTINFRREAYLREVARRRQRIVSLGLWVAYYGTLCLVVGLYGLNCTTLSRRSAMLERQTAQIHRTNAAQVATVLRPQEMALVERYATSTRRWRDRLEHVGAAMPMDARLTGLVVNPQNLSDASSQNALVISGALKGTHTGDRIQGVMKIVSSLRADSVFHTGYKNIKLASTRVAEDGGVEFVIECR
jgi:hypothetical protein